MRNFIVIATAAATLLFFSSFLLIYDELILSLQIAIYTFAFGFVIVSIVLTIFICFSGYERYRKMRAERIEQEKNANVMTVTAGDQVFIRETDHDATWRAAHLDARAYANGRDTYEPASQEEIEAWHYFNKPSQKLIEGQLVSRNGNNKPSTFYDLLNDYPHLMLVAPTTSGKTTQMSLAMEYRLKQYPDANAIWLSTHAKLDKNMIPSQADVIREPISIARALRCLCVEYEKRYKYDGQYQPIIIAIDEWTEIVDRLKIMDTEVEPGEFLRWTSRGGRKIGFYLILASHGGNVKDLDTAGFSSIKSEFAQVHLDAKLTRQGKAVWQQLGNKSSRVEIVLPQIVTMTEKQKEIVGMYNGGEHDLNIIAQYVYSGRGGNQVRRVEETVKKFCAEP